MSFPTPTNGQGTALVVTVSGTNVVKLASQLAAATSAQNTAPSGTQFNAWFGGSFPGGADFAAYPGVVANDAQAGYTPGANQYGLTLSLSSKTVNGVSLSNACTLTVTAYDAIGDSELDTGVLYMSYGDPSATSNTGAGGNANWNPKTASTGFPLPTNNNGQVASVSSSGVITAIAVGQCIVEVQVPFALNTLSNMSGDSMPGATTGSGNEVRQMVYAQIVVQVIA